MEKKKGLAVVIIILVAVVLLTGPSLLANLTGPTAPQIDPTPTAFSVRVQEVSRQTLQAHLNVNGDVVSTQQVDVFPDVAGLLVSVQAPLGAFVQQGSVIAVVDPSRPGAVFMNSPVYAPISGFIARTSLSVGTMVSPNVGITSISGGGTLEINTRIPEREIAGLTAGLSAEVGLQAFPGEIFPATIVRVSPVVDSISRTKLVNLQFDQNDNRITPGMFANIRLTTRTYENVIAVPSEAVVSSWGVNIVYVIDPAAEQPLAQRREVTTGVTLQGQTEIIAGLAEGEAVVIQGQRLLSDGTPVRIVGGI